MGTRSRFCLPVYGLFMQKVYADKSLGYSEEEEFEIPEQYMDPCANKSSESTPQGQENYPGGIEQNVRIIL